LGRRPDQEPDLPVPGVVSQRHRAPVLAAQAAVGAEDDVLRPFEGRGTPPHAHVLRQAEEVAARLLAQHVGSERQSARWSLTGQPAGGHGARRAEHRIERRRIEPSVHVYAAVAAGAGPASTNRLVTGSIRKLSPSRVPEPNNTRSPGSPNTTSSAARFPTT